MSKKIASVTKSFPTKRRPGPKIFTGQFYKTTEEKLIPILLKIFQKIEEEGALPTIFCKASISLLPETDKETISKENYRSILLMNKHTKSSQIKN